MPPEQTPPEPEDDARPAVFYLDQYHINKGRLHREWVKLLSLCVFTALMAGNWWRGLPLMPGGTDLAFIIVYGAFPFVVLFFWLWYFLRRIERAENAVRACLWQVMYWIDTPRGRRGGARPARPPLPDPYFLLPS